MSTIALASFFGSAIEWYEFFLFASASALVFGPLFFPSADPMTGTLLSFGTLGVGFLSRPVGAVAAGHLGDRVGRKHVLVATLLVMGLATTSIGVLPGYDSIGVWAPIALVALRILQGLAVGGEWGGAALIAVEHSSEKSRGFYGSVPQMGLPAGLLLATVALELSGRAMDEQAFAEWGWRLPFLAAAPLVLVGLLIRLRINEPPAFRAVLDEQRREKLPVLAAIRRYPKQILLAAGMRFADNILYYVFATFGLTYMTGHLGMHRSTVLLAIMAAAGLELITLPVFGALSDRIGRKPVVLVGASLAVLLPVPFFWLADTGNGWLVLCAEVLMLSIAHAAVFAPLAAWFAEMFSPEVRYSGITLGFQIGALLSGAPAPLLATALLARYGDMTPVALVAGAGSLVTAICAIMAKDMVGRDRRDAIADPTQSGDPEPVASQRVSSGPRTDHDV